MAFVQALILFCCFVPKKIIIINNALVGFCLALGCGLLLINRNFGDPKRHPFGLCMITRAGPSPHLKPTKKFYIPDCDFISEGRKINMITHSICAVSLPSCSCSRSIPFHHPRLPRRHTSFASLSFARNCSQFNDLCVPSFTPTPATSCSKNHNPNNAEPDPNRTQRLFQQFYLSVNSENAPDKNPGAQNQKEDLGQEDQKRSANKGRGLLTNMWWANLKAAIGQRLNIEGIVSSAAVITRDRHLALPHVFVPDVRYIDWDELHRRGFKGVVFDKDNTITAPYCLTIWAPLKSSLEQCKSVFGQNIAVFSNSAGNIGSIRLQCAHLNSINSLFLPSMWAFTFTLSHALGLYEYDHDGSKAKALESSTGIRVIRHSECDFSILSPISETCIYARRNLYLLLRTTAYILYHFHLL